MQRIRIKCLPGSSFKLSGSHLKKNIKKIKKVVDIFCPLLYTNSCVTERTQTNPSGCGSAWLERLVWDQEVAGSNPVTPTTCGCSSMVEHQPSKLDTWVRFPSPALVQGYRSGHNEAVLKTVCPQGRVGSNPTPCASYRAIAKW